MKVSPIKTNKITEKDTDIFAILDRFLPKIEEETIVAITSKIISICEGRIVPFSATDKDKLIEQEADYYLPRQENVYNYSLTITRNLLLPAAGIDESNSHGHYILWPENPQKTANAIRTYLRRRFSLNHLGIIITDSKTSPLRWGSTGISLAYSGFLGLHDYRHKQDLFGREMKITQANIADALAASAVLVMGEGTEQTPIALIKDATFVTFRKSNPSEKELRVFSVTPERDLYGSIIMKSRWRKGKKR